MKKLIVIILLLISIKSFSQIVLTIEGIDTTLLTTDGYNIPRANPTNLTFRNNKLTPTQSEGFTLQCGSDDSGLNDNMLDGAVISGNKLYSNANLGSHGMMLGYNIDYHVKYNYVDGIKYGAVVEGNDVMAYTEGGIYYNIFKSNNTNCVTMGGTIGLPIYNNTFYSNRSSSSIFAIIRLSTYAENTKIKNNIFYAKHNSYMIYLDSANLADLECDYNVYYVEDGTHQPLFYNHSTSTQYTFAQWQALGFDTHSVVVNPNFNDTINFVPAVRLDYGIDVGAEYDYGLATSAEWVVGEYPDTTVQNGTWQVGAITYEADEAPPSETCYYVAVGGSNAAAGTIDAPWATFAYAVSQVSAGDTVYFRGGVYSLPSQISIGLTGTAGNEYHFWNYPGEKPIWDATGGRTDGPGIFMSGASYIHLKGLTVRNLAQVNPVNYAVGIYCYFSSNITIENCVCHDIGVRGFYSYASDEIYYINCDAYNIFNVVGDGAHGDGYIVWDRHNASYPQDTTYSVYFRGCRAWKCADDGWDAESEGYIELDSCWAFDNGNPSGPGNGFKLGLVQINSANIGKKVTNCIAAYNNVGLTTNDDDRPAKKMFIYNNITYNNNTYGFFIETTSTIDNQRIFRNNVSYDNPTNILVPGSATYTHSNNTWDIPITIQASDFVSLDSTGITAARQDDGSLPDNDCYKYFLNPSSTFQGYQQGVDVNLTYDAAGNLWRTPPSIGFKEYYPTTPAVDPVLADIVTYHPYWLTTTTASSGGFVADDGGDPGGITQKGVCWNTTGTPTTADSKTEEGTGDGAFTSTMTGLTQSTTYYVRAYAINSVGTAYGSQMTFRTQIIKHLNKVIKHLGIFMIVN